MRLGHEAADRDGAADVLLPAGLPAGLDHLDGEVGDLQHVLVGLGGQPAHEVELHLAPAVGVRRRHRADEVLLGHRLVDHPADALAAALGGEGQAAAPSVAGQLVGQRDVEGVDAGARQAQADLGVLVAVGELLGQLADLGVVGAGQAEEADLLVAGRLEPLVDHRADAGDRPLPHRAGDHAGLAEAAAAGAAAEDLDAHPLVDALGQRHQRRLRVGPLVEVHDGALADLRGHVVAGAADRRDRAVRTVGDGVEARHVDAVDPRQAGQQLVATAGTALGLPRLDDVGDVADHLLAVTEDGGVDEVADRLRVERGVPTGDDDRVGLVAVLREDRDARQVEGLEQVGVAQFGGEADAEQVEVADGAVAVDGELRDAVLAHEGGEVRPDGVGALGQGVGALVEHLVQDHQALVGQPHLVGVGIHQRPVHGGVVPRFDLGVELTADVLDRLLDLCQQRFEAGVESLTSHDGPRVAAVTRPAPLAARSAHSPGSAA